MSVPTEGMALPCPQSWCLLLLAGPCFSCCWSCLCAGMFWPGQGSAPPSCAHTLTGVLLQLWHSLSLLLPALRTRPQGSGLGLSVCCSGSLCGIRTLWNRGHVPILLPGEGCARGALADPHLLPSLLSLSRFPGPGSADSAALGVSEPRTNRPDHLLRG